MYPGITRYREEYVLPTAIEHGKLHLALGFSIWTDNPSKDIRTLANATCQVWSILTQIAINKIHQLIDQAGYQDDIKVTSTIYDSIYFEIRDDPKIIQWLNNRIVPILEKDFMEDQVVPNSADLELGSDWATLHTLTHNASIREITGVLNKLER
jgi:hypothetical protein